jgi:hypothetical protein
MLQILQRYGVNYVDHLCNFKSMSKIVLSNTMEKMESVPYITDIANQWVSGAALFFISNRSVGKRGNTSSVVGHCIL